VSERRLGTVLTRQFTRVAWTGLAGYALLVVALFAVAAEMALRRSLEHSADLTQSLLGAYRDSTSEPGGVMPSALADRLVRHGGQVVITRTTTGVGGKQDVYFVSPDMPAKRLEGLPASASSDDVAPCAAHRHRQRARWRYRVLHRAAGVFDIYVVASRESYVVALGALAAAAALLLPGAGLAVARGARQAVAVALRPLERVAAETRAIGPAELGTRLTSPTGQTEVTELARASTACSSGWIARIGPSRPSRRTRATSYARRSRTCGPRSSGQRPRAAPRRRPATRSERWNAFLDQTAKLVEELLLIARARTASWRSRTRPSSSRRWRRSAGDHGSDGRRERSRRWCDAVAAAVGPGRRRSYTPHPLEPRLQRRPLHANGRITFTLETNGKMVGVSVRDTGLGIAAEHVERIFDRFSASISPAAATWG